MKEIKLTNGNSIVIIGIDGDGGSGKTTLANRIASEIQNTQIVHMDDFYKLKECRKLTVLANAPSGYEYDIDRLISQVITPVLSNKIAEYQKYDWGNDYLKGCEKIIPSGVLIIEGCYSMIKQLYGFCQLKIFVNCERSIRLKRGLERDGKSALPFWMNWMDGEDKYFSEQYPRDNADFVFSSDSIL